MTMNMHQKTHFRDFLIVFLLLFFSKETLLFGTNSDKRFFWVHVATLLLLVAYFLVITKKIRISFFRYVAGLLVLHIFTLLITRDIDYLKFFYSSILLILSALVVTNISFNNFVDSYLKVLYFLSVFSIVVFLISQFTPAVLGVFPEIINESGIRYSFLGFGVVQKVSEISIFRMYSVFREPGVFGSFLSLAILLELFLKRAESKKRLVAFLVAVVLTFSTGADIAVSLLFVLFFAEKILKKRYPRTRKRNGIVWISILSLFVLLFSVEIGISKIFDVVFKKLLVDNSSRDARFGSVAANLRIFFRSPLWGNGWSFVQDNFLFFAEKGLYDSKHNTNTLLKYLAIYGFFPFSCICWGIYRFFKLISKHFSMCAVLVFLWAIILSNEDFTLNVLFYVFPFYGAIGSVDGLKLDEKRDALEENSLC